MATRAGWTCPDCGARLVHRDLWHSCGRWTLAELFAGADPATLELARSYVALLDELGDVQVLPQRTRLTCVADVRFAGLLPRRHGLVATFALREPLEDHDRIRRVEEHGPRWFTHHVLVTRPDELDDELRGWLQRSHDTVGLRR